MFSLPLLFAALAAAEPGSVHADHAATALGAGLRAPAWRAAGPPTPGPDRRVYGYKAYWSGTLADMPWDELSDIALFSADVASDGSLSNTSRWGDVAAARATADPYGVRVHLCITNFDRESLRTLLGSSTARAALISRLGSEVRSRGAHGVNVDFEGVPAERRAEMVAFVRDLAAEVGEVVVATPAVDWSSAWDYAALSTHADLFIMGYGYHWAGSSNAGPVDPLYGGVDFYDRSLDWSVRDYVTKGARKDRILLGLPLYGLEWPTANDAVPGTATARGSSVVWTNARSGATTHGARWHAHSHSPWYFTGTSQVWHPNVQGVSDRAIYARDADLGGIGFWALNYDAGDPALWEVVREATHDAAPEPEPEPDDTDDTAVPDDTGLPDDTGVPDEDGPLRADAGRPFLAYPRDIVILNGGGSRGPAGATLTYDWTQVAGPPVALEMFEPDRPRFVVGAAGVHTFELRVSANGETSAPARTDVIVLDRDAGGRFASGCATGGASAGAWALLGLLGMRRRR